MRYCTFILQNSVAAKYDGTDYPWSEERPCGSSLKRMGKHGLYICRNCDMVYVADWRMAAARFLTHSVISITPHGELPTTPPPLEPQAAMDWASGVTRRESKFSKWFRNLPDQRQ